MKTWKAQQGSCVKTTVHVMEDGEESGVDEHKNRYDMSVIERERNRERVILLFGEGGGAVAKS